MHLTKLLCSLLFIILFSTGHAGSWATKTLKEMSTDEKIGQLFMIAGYVDPVFAKQETEDPQILEKIESLLTQYSIGSLALAGPSNVSNQVALLNHYQKISKYPLLIAQDLEWGLSMRLTDGMRLPKNITLGAINDNSLIYQMGLEIARQGRLIGVHMNLSPVLDVNIEPENPAINVRSFGDSPEVVASKGIAMIHGLQDGSMIASAKHFPGLGDISTDPHLDLPSNTQNRERLEAVELYPFEQAVKAGVLSIQTEHVSMPALEPDSHIPSSLSPKIVQGILKDRMGFQGVVISGALRMKALTNYFSQEEIAVRAFLAGNDILLMPQDFPTSFQAIKQALQTGRITIEQINERVLKILELKEGVGLDKNRLVDMPSTVDLHTAEGLALKKKLYSKAVCLLRDENGLIPLQQSLNEAVAYVQIGSSVSDTYYETIKQQMNLDRFSISLDYSDPIEGQVLLEQLEKYPLIILAIFPADPRRITQIRLLNAQKQIEELSHFRVHGLPKPITELIDSLKQHQKKTIVNFFGNPFGLRFFSGFSTFIMGYEDDAEAQAAAATLFSIR